MKCSVCNLEFPMALPEIRFDENLKRERVCYSCILYYCVAVLDGDPNTDISWVQAQSYKTFGLNPEVIHDCLTVYPSVRQND